MVRIIGFKFVAAAALALASTSMTVLNGASAAYDSNGASAAYVSNGASAAYVSNGASAAYYSRTHTTPGGRKTKQPSQSKNGQPFPFPPGRYPYKGGVLWQPPVDIECRDLFYGAGGRAGAPDTSAPFTYVRRVKSGTQKKIVVQDVNG